MKEFKDRRGCPRSTLDTPLIGLVQFDTYEYCSDISSFEQASHAFYLTVCDIGEKGARVESSYDLTPVPQLLFLIFDRPNTAWKACYARAAWSRRDSTRNQYAVGLAFSAGLEDSSAVGKLLSGYPIPKPDDLQFLTATPLIRSIPENAVCRLLNSLAMKTLQSGDRLFSQGDVGDALYIIQEGKCTVQVPKDGKLCLVARLMEGDVVGEMAVLTGEPRSAHVEAETPMKLWGLGKAQFEMVSAECPDLRFFLTELVTHRFESEPLTGERAIGKYTIKNKLGKGGWSIVYHGVHKILNVPVAIKMLKHNMAMEQSFLDKFRNEAKIIARMNHRNIVRVYDIEEAFHTVFIIMEYLEGQGLDGLLVRMGIIPVPQAVDLLVQICEGLAYAHEQGIVHQDIKPANIFVQAEDRVRILDFGLACPSGSEDLNMAGTIYYAAPEQLEGHQVDVRTDIYALGITAYELVTGRRPYPEDDLNELVERRLHQDVPDPCELHPGIPESLRNFILKACSRNPAHRYQDIGEALSDLRPLHADLCRTSDEAALERHQVMSMFFVFREEHQLALNRLLEEFGSKVQDLGVVVKVAHFKDV